ncbi:fms-related tyrosine kinase 3 ligand isoform X9 [Pongo pygmaeus]|uniref:fms-related tyrosine kinase 3 ligand isoform X9 n=1 Tax=Pongo pygmaeus TaxID=9600 RepID=UPI00300C9033
MTVLAPAWSPTTYLLLLLLLSSGLSRTQDCSFQHSPISSDFAVKIRELSDYLLQDYPVTVASNLQDESESSAPPPSDPGAPAQLLLPQTQQPRAQLLPQTRGFSPLGGALRGPLAAGPGTALDGAAQDCRWVQDARLAGAREHGDTLCHQMCLSDSSTLLPPWSPQPLEATAPTAPQPPLLLLLLLPVGLLLLAAAWCLHWQRTRRRTPRPGEQGRTLRHTEGSHQPEDA